MTAVPEPNSIALFDELAEDYGQLVPMFETYGQKLVALMGPRPGTAFLDIGAGRGAVAVAAMERGANVVAVDASPKMAQALERDHPTLTVRLMDAHRLEFSAGAFDMASASFVIHVVEDPSRVLAEAYRVLRPGGLLALTTPGRTDESWEEYFALFSRFRPRPGASQVAQRLDVMALMKEAGYSNVETATIEVDLPVASPALLWDFEMSHGFAGYVRSLSPSDQQEFKRQVLLVLERMHRDGGIRLRREATVHTGRSSPERG